MIARPNTVRGSRAASTTPGHDGHDGHRARRRAERHARAGCRDDDHDRAPASASPNTSELPGRRPSARRCRRCVAGAEQGDRRHEERRRPAGCTGDQPGPGPAPPEPNSTLPRLPDPATWSIRVCDHSTTASDRADHDAGGGPPSAVPARVVTTCPTSITTRQRRDEHRVRQVRLGHEARRRHRRHDRPAGRPTVTAHVGDEQAQVRQDQVLVLPGRDQHLASPSSRSAGRPAPSPAITARRPARRCSEPGDRDDRGDVGERRPRSRCRPSARPS